MVAGVGGHPVANYLTMGENGVREEEASVIDFFYRGGGRERGERTAVPRVSDDTPAATRSGRDAAR
jgi:hypothetical protein